MDATDVLVNLPGITSRQPGYSQCTVSREGRTYLTLGNMDLLASQNDCHGISFERKESWALVFKLCQKPRLSSACNRKAAAERPTNAERQATCALLHHISGNPLLSAVRSSAQTLLTKRGPTSPVFSSLINLVVEFKF